MDITFLTLEFLKLEETEIGRTLESPIMALIRPGFIIISLVRPGEWSPKITHAQLVVPDHKHEQNVGSLACYLAIPLECSFKLFILMSAC